MGKVILPALRRRAVREDDLRQALRHRVLRDLSPALAKPPLGALGGELAPARRRLRDGHRQVARPRVAALAPAPRAGALPHGHERDLHPTTANAELCENLYKTLRRDAGADAEFWVEDAFVHFHYRDLRVEMPIGDFLAFSKTMSERARSFARTRSARSRICSGSSTREHRLRRPAELGGASRRASPSARTPTLTCSSIRSTSSASTSSGAASAPTPRTSASSGRCRCSARPGSRATSSSTSARPTMATCPRTGAIAS